MIYNSTQIKEILKKEHLVISKRRGQNFLVSQDIQKKIIEAAALSSSDEVLEIGPGLGALTEELAKKTAQVFAVEKDKGLARFLSATLGGYPNLTLLHQDILETNIRKFPSQGLLKVVGNLPYYITTPILGFLLEKQRQKLKEIYITVQEEVGRRFVGTKDTKEYSALTILTNYFSSPKILFSIPKKAFYPQPKVDSVYMRLCLLKEPPVFVHSQEQFFKIVRATFTQRRKIILNSLAHHIRERSKNDLAEILRQSGVNYLVRPENLSLQDFAIIENTFHAKEVSL
ncbi:MAG: 16S rRNA (adenine(1518)-N(6)/adenine(1519)-N(6))-dimethyltransferase RsmA [Candidatus Omnitrophota bacterium]